MTAKHLKYRKYNLAAAAQRRLQPGYKEYMKPLQRKSLLKRYGITHQDYLIMLAHQGFACAICHRTNPGTSKSEYFDVDHNHETGQVRALLCRDCNVTAGVVENKWEKILAIREYLAHHVEYDTRSKVSTTA